MLSFQLTANGNQASQYDTIEGLLQQLREYGYAASCNDLGSNHAYVGIINGSQSLMDEDVELTPLFIKELARFTELAFVQFTLDGLMPRMTALGWNVTLYHPKDGPRIELQTPVGSSAYKATYSDMLQLRRSVATAEVTYTICRHLPQMVKAGWSLKTRDGEHVITTPGGHLYVLAIDDVEGAKRAVAELSSAKSAFR